MTEHDIQGLIMAALSQHGVVFRCNAGAAKTEDGRLFRGMPPGFSDLLFVGLGYVAFIEAKAPGGRLTDKQRSFLRQMRQLGHPAGVARSVADALNIIRRDADGYPRADETAMMFKSDEENRADRALFVHNLGILLSQTREGITGAYLTDHETVVVTYRDGYTEEINVRADSYLAIIRDVTRKL